MGFNGWYGLDLDFRVWVRIRVLVKGIRLSSEFGWELVRWWVGMRQWVIGMSGVERRWVWVDILFYFILFCDRGFWKGIDGGGWKEDDDGRFRG